MPKKRRVICVPCSSVSTPVATGGTVKQMMNTGSRYQIKALVASAIQLHYHNGIFGDTDANLPTTLSVQSAFRAYSGSPSGSFVQPGTLSIAKGQKTRTSVIAATLSAGQTVEIATFANAGSGKCPPTTTQVQPAWTIGSFSFPAWKTSTFNNSLTPVLDGSLTDSTVNTVSTYRAYHPMAISGLTATKAIAFLGHSLVSGVGSNYEVSYASYAALQAGCASIQGGVAGSGVSGWASSVDRGNLELADVVVINWVINNINEQVGIVSPSTFVTNESALIIPIIRDLKSMGKKVVLTTEGPCGDMVSQTTPAHLAMLQAWNAYVRTDGVSTMGADAVFDIANVLFTSISPDSGMLKSAYETDLGVGGERIHWGNVAHYDVGVALGNALVATGWLGEDDTTWTENYRETFDGLATGGGSFGRWTYRDYYNKNIFPLSGRGSLGVTAPVGGGVFSAYQSDNTTGFTQGRLELNFTFGGIADSVTYPNVDGFGVGFCSQDLVGGRFFLDGYFVYARGGSLRLDAVNSAFPTGTQLASATYSTTPAVGRMCKLILEMTNNTTAGRDLSCKMYYGSTLIANLTVTGNTSTTISSATLYPAIGYIGVGIGGADPSTRGAFAHTFVAYDYTATAPASVTVSPTLQVERGGRRPISVVVKDSSGVVMAGVTVSASTSASGTCVIGAVVITDGAGVALFDDADAASVPGSATLNATATLTFTAGPVSGTTVVTAVNTLASSGRKGIQGGMDVY